MIDRGFERPFALWQQRKWRRLLSLIDDLPSNSRFVEAQLNDPDVATHVVDNEDKGEAKKSGGRIRDFSPTVRALAGIYDQLAVLNANFVAANNGGKRPPKPKFYDRPKTLIEEMRTKRRLRRHESIVARVLPSNRR